MRFLPTLAALVTLPLLAVGCATPREDYVRADRATFDTVAPVIRALADEDPSNDPDLTGVNGEALLGTLRTWELRLKRAEEEL